MPNIFGKYSNDVQLLDQLQEEFLTYQGTAKTEIPQNVWDNAAIRQGQTSVHYRMDIVWAYLKEPLPLLSQVALTILTIPYSNGAEERGFSMIKKNKNDFCANLDLSKSLDSIMVIKMTSPESLMPCFR